MNTNNYSLQWTLTTEQLQMTTYNLNPLLRTENDSNMLKITKRIQELRNAVMADSSKIKLQVQNNKTTTELLSDWWLQSS